MKKFRQVRQMNIAKNRAMFRAAACCAFLALMLCGGCSDNGMYDAFVEDMLPKRPSSVTATATSSTGIAISWTAVSKAADYVVYRYDNDEYYRSREWSTESTAYKDENLSSNTTYYYAVSARNKAGESSMSSRVSATTETLRAPTDVTASLTSKGDITVGWSAVAGATGYRVYRSASANGTYSEIGTTSWSTSYTNTGLTPGATYYYTVTAYDYGSESEKSSYASATTAAVPSGVTATAVSSNGITVRWLAASGATGYYVYRSESATGAYSKIDSTKSASYTNTGLSPNTTYYYKVSAYNRAGETSQSSYTSAKTPPDAPSGVAAKATSSNSITVSWSKAPGVTGYYVYRSTSTTDTYGKVETTSSTSYTNSGLSSGTTYYYQVSAYNDGGESSPSTYVAATTLTSVPVPSNIGATVTSSGDITVSWSAAPGVTGYNVYRSTSATGTYTKVGTTTFTSYTNTGLSSLTTYYYKVSAYNSTDESSQSSYISATTIIITKTFTDNRDGTMYKAVIIGGKTWMAENLNYETSSGSWCYDDEPDNCDRYGRLYDRDAEKRVCPTGWHLPSRAEWDQLVMAAGGYSTAGKRLKSTSGWCCDGNGTDDYGFSALPGGHRYSLYGGGFAFADEFGFWWSASEYNDGFVDRRDMNASSDHLDESRNFEEGGFSVRCVQD